MNIVLILLVCLLTCIGQLCQKKAVQHWSEQHLSAMQKLMDPWLIAAIASLGLGMLVWLMVLPRVSLNIAYPMLSLNFVFVTLASRIWFHEETNARHWWGIAFIMMGVFLLGAYV